MKISMLGPLPIGYALKLATHSLKQIRWELLDMVDHIVALPVGDRDVLRTRGDERQQIGRPTDLQQIRTVGTGNKVGRHLHGRRLEPLLSCLDGHVVHGVRSIRFEKKAQSMPVVSIDMNCIDMTVDSPFITQLEGKDGENEIIFKFKDDNEPK